MIWNHRKLQWSTVANPTHLGEVRDSLIKDFGVFDLRESVAEEHRCEDESVQEGDEDGDGISVEDKGGQNRVGYFTHGVTVGGSDRLCRYNVLLADRCCRSGRNRWQCGWRMLMSPSNRLSAPIFRFPQARANR